MFHIYPLNAMKICIWKCRLFMSSAEYSCKLFKPIFAYRQTLWTQIRLLLKEQSDLGPHCLQKWHKITSRWESRRQLLWLNISIGTDRRSNAAECNIWSGYTPLILSLIERFLVTSVGSIMDYPIYRMYSERQGWATSVDPNEIRRMRHLIRVYTVCHSSSNF